VGVAINPAGSRVYVANRGDNTVSVIDTGTNTVTGAPIPVGGQPFGIDVHPKGTYVYVANSFDNTVSVISAATNLVVATVPVGTTPRAIGRFIGPVTSPIPTPTLSEWALAATALLLLAVGLLRRRAR
jgi:YVTN family beta-propeller protein